MSGYLYYWECHRTHTVAPPPSNYKYNPYCRTDEDPHLNSESVVLRAVEALVGRDAKREDVVGYWVLDDWAWWDGGSAHALLQRVHALITAKTPGKPAICGFGAGIGGGDHSFWDAAIAKNYSNSGCDIVGWYVYSSFGETKPSLGANLNWAMRGLLPRMARSLAQYGWAMRHAPLYGIGQAWSGRYDGHRYQPGLTAAEMQAQAAGFCSFGARYVGWYAWDDSGFDRGTQTPNNSPAIAEVIGNGIVTCKRSWGI